MFQPNARVTILRRRAFKPDEAQGLRVVDDNAVDVVAMRVPVWIAEEQMQHAPEASQNAVYHTTQLQALLWPQYNWQPRIRDVLYLAATQQTYEIRSIYHTIMVSCMTPIQAELTTTSVAYGELESHERVWGPVFDDIFG